MGYLGEFLGSGSTTTKGLYHLNGNATDSSGNGNNGTATNVTWVGGKIGSGAASFNGSSSKLVKYPFPGTTTITMSCWLKIQGTSPFQQVPLRIDTNTNITRNLITFYFPVNTYNIIGGCYNPIMGGFESTPFTLTPNIRYLATLVITGSSGVQSMYINGNQVGGNLNIGNLGAPNALGIGCAPQYYGGGVQPESNFFKGEVDEVIIENRARTAQEVKKYYTYSQGKFGIL